ncbi:MAG: hypothetical protein IT445_00930 [Phycisphaeraceae bacterium]|nr:hypothetical protein [Phycisphaeraceae bacterium]
MSAKITHHHEATVLKASPVTLRRERVGGQVTTASVNARSQKRSQTACFAVLFAHRSGSHGRSSVTFHVESHGNHRRNARGGISANNRDYRHKKPFCKSLVIKVKA